MFGEFTGTHRSDVFDSALKSLQDLLSLSGALWVGKCLRVEAARGQIRRMNIYSPDFKKTKKQKTGVSQHLHNFLILPMCYWFIKQKHKNVNKVKHIKHYIYTTDVFT